MSAATLSFWGASGTVTGSKYLLRVAGKKILVDCGMYQGEAARTGLNRAPWPHPPSEIDAVVLTHGHLDHVGLLPRLFREGFRGTIYGTAPSLEIAGIVLEDSAEIQLEVYQKALRDGVEAEPLPPLYEPEDVKGCLRLFASCAVGEWVSLFPELRFRFQYNGHILGAAFLDVEAEGRRIVFSGDIGRPDDPVLFPPERPKRADILLLESTYGDRQHPGTDARSVLRDEILTAIAEGGSCIIPCFAVQRMQTVMYLLWQLRISGEIPGIPIFADSPMGADVFWLFRQFPEWHRLDPESLKAMTRHIAIIREYADTWKAVDLPGSKVILAGSGMLTGGRVLTYLSQWLDRPSTRIILVGFQAEGTRGRSLAEGAETLEIFGKSLPVRAAWKQVEMLSAHADQRELLWWLDALEQPPVQTYLVHGETEARAALAGTLTAKGFPKVFQPGLWQEYELWR